MTSLQTTVKNNSKYTEDWLPIKDIKNGMIEVEGKIGEGTQLVVGVRIEPKNIFISEQSIQDRTIAALRNFYNTIDFEFWLTIADRPVDINLYLAQLQVLYQKTNDNVKRKLIMQDINKANAFMGAEYNVVDTEYFLLFKERRMDIIQKRLRTLSMGLANCGLNAFQVSNSDLRMILDNFLNGGVTTTFGTVIG
mgnify:CR=1 FL=1